MKKPKSKPNQWRGAALLLFAFWVGCRKSPVPPPYPGSLIEVTSRILPNGPPIGRIMVSADEGTSLRLHSVGSPSELQGALALTPGKHTVKIEALNQDGGSVAAVSVPLTTALGAPLRLEVTPAAVGVGTIESILVPRSSTVVGERLLLQARTLRPDDAVQVVWTATPSGCGTFTQPSVLTTEWIGVAPGRCVVSLATTSGSGQDRRSVEIAVRTKGTSYQFPLRVALSGRYLVDQRGTPFLIKGEAAWLALVNLTEAEQERYLLDRSAKGFNLVEVMLANHNYTKSPSPTPPSNRLGEQPFSKAGDFSTPNDAYFDRVARFVDRAASVGIAVLITPNFLGFDGDHEGWWKETISAANNRAVCARFGRYLGARFKDKQNVIWLAGGDFAPPAGSEGEARHGEVMNGIRAAGASQLWTGHWNFKHQGGLSTDEERFRDAMSLDGVYQYANPYKYTARAFGVRPVRPVYLLESTYEHEHPTNNTQPFRKAWWWTMLSGGIGLLWGNTFLWTAESLRGTYPIDYGDVDHAVSSWEAEMESPGTYQVLHLHALFEQLPWHRLVPAGVPSGLPELVTSGQRSGQRHIAAAATPEGDLLVAYVPPTGADSREFALDFSRMGSLGRAGWYDPAAGAWIALDPRLPNAQEVAIKTPGPNRSGTNDWVLVVEASPRR